MIKNKKYRKRTELEKCFLFLLFLFWMEKICWKWTESEKIILGIKNFVTKESSLIFQNKQIYKTNQHPKSFLRILSYPKKNNNSRARKPKSFTRDFLFPAYPPVLFSLLPTEHSSSVLLWTCITLSPSVFHRSKWNKEFVIVFVLFFSTQFLHWQTRTPFYCA